MTPADFPRYTYNDYKNWKEDWELVAGYPLQMLPSVSFKHNKILGKLTYQCINSLLNSGDSCDCAVVPELDWKINDDTVVRPDLMVICGNSQNEFLERPPAMVIEILSPSNMKTDRVIKFQLYQENGVQFYLMVDPLRSKVEAFELIDNKYRQVDTNVFSIDKNCIIDLDYDNLWK
jgi:Uma2 family endonuclease